jgi:hypothetical protein
MRYYSNQSSNYTSDKTGENSLILACNTLDVQNVGTTICYFDGFYIAPGTGKKFPLEVSGELAIYDKKIELTFDGGIGNVIVNQTSYKSNK